MDTNQKDTKARTANWEPKTKKQRKKERKDATPLSQQPSRGKMEMENRLEMGEIGKLVPGN